MMTGKQPDDHERCDQGNTGDRGVEIAEGKPSIEPLPGQWVQ